MVETLRQASGERDGGLFFGLVFIVYSKMLPAILLVDDDATTNFLNQRLLSRLNVSRAVHVAGNGVEALTRLQACCQEAPDTFPVLILLDVNMPVMNGFEFLEAYQQLPAAPRRHTVIVMLTTSTLDADQLRAQQLPIAGYLTKPLTRENMATVLRVHFNLPPHP